MVKVTTAGHGLDHRAAQNYLLLGTVLLKLGVRTFGAKPDKLKIKLAPEQATRIDGFLEQKGINIICIESGVPKGVIENVFRSDDGFPGLIVVPLLHSAYLVNGNAVATLPLPTACLEAGRGRPLAALAGFLDLLEHRGELVGQYREPLRIFMRSNVSLLSQCIVEGSKHELSSKDVFDCLDAVADHALNIKFVHRLQKLDPEDSQAMLALDHFLEVFPENAAQYLDERNRILEKWQPDEVITPERQKEIAGAWKTLSKQKIDQRFVELLMTMDGRSFVRARIASRQATLVELAKIAAACEQAISDAETNSVISGLEGYAIEGILGRMLEGETLSKMAQNLVVELFTDDRYIFPELMEQLLEAARNKGHKNNKLCEKIVELVYGRHYKEGLELLSNGDFETAVGEFRLAVEAFPASGEALSVLGNCLLPLYTRQKGTPEGTAILAEARQVLEKARGISRGRSFDLYNLSFVCLASGEIEKGLDNLEQFLDQMQGSSHEALVAALVLSNLNGRVISKEQLARAEKIIKVLVGHVRVLRSEGLLREDISRLVKMCSSLAQLANLDEDEELAGTIKSIFLSFNFILRTVTNHSGGQGSFYYEALYIRAQVLRQLGKYNEAIKCLKGVIESERTVAIEEYSIPFVPTGEDTSLLMNAYHLAGLILQEQAFMENAAGRKVEASNILTISIALLGGYAEKIDHPLIWNVMGTAWLAMRDFREAEKTFRRALVKYPYLLHIRLNLLFAIYHQGDSELFESELKKVKIQFEKVVADEEGRTRQVDLQLRANLESLLQATKNKTFSYLLELCEDPAQEIV
ncbi:MAG: tetratricopeptide repeat protein [Candidatus Margulisiibacteriota bacterium]